ncbi:MAG: hypothetical protein AB7L17_04650 [Ilumatobacteraceae bacterium]
MPFSIDALRERMIEPEVLDRDRARSGRAQVPALHARRRAELLRRIMKQEGRHIDFYASQAMRRLRSDRRAQRLTRFALRRMWKPVGSDVMPAAEVAHLIGFLFGDADGRAMAERIDRRIDRLPGLAGLHLVARAA